MITIKLLVPILLLIIYFIYTNIQVNWRSDEFGLDLIGGIKGDNTVENEKEISSTEIGFKKKNDIEKFQINSSPLNYNMGRYSNILLNKNTNNIPLKNSIYTVFGSQIPLQKKISIDDNLYGPNVDGTVSSPKSMAMFKFNYCKPECCPSIYSCSNGCICQTKNQNKFISSRGNNV